MLELVGERHARATFSDRRSKQERLSVSIPAELVAYVRDEAERLQEAQSAIVAEALRQMRIEGLRNEIMHGLIQDAEWHQEMAREGMVAAPRLSE